ncbi:hypothetical protein ACA910_001947 [Epithemia clementina (nom. ined.)]
MSPSITSSPFRSLVETTISSRAAAAAAVLVEIEDADDDSTAGASAASPTTNATTISELLPTTIRKSNNNSKPKKPLSAYNLFFQLERQRILERGVDHAPLPITLPDLEQVNHAHLNKTGKRAHRKSHGMIGFHELAHIVARRWKELDEDDRNLMRSYTKQEKQKYVLQMKAWGKQNQDAAADKKSKTEVTTTTKSAASSKKRKAKQHASASKRCKLQLSGHSRSSSSSIATSLRSDTHVHQCSDHMLHSPSPTFPQEDLSSTSPPAKVALTPTPSSSSASSAFVAPTSTVTPSTSSLSFYPRATRETSTAPSSNAVGSGAITPLNPFPSSLNNSMWYNLNNNNNNNDMCQQQQQQESVPPQVPDRLPDDLKSIWCKLNSDNGRSLEEDNHEELDCAPLVQDQLPEDLNSSFALLPPKMTMATTTFAPPPSEVFSQQELDQQAQREIVEPLNSSGIFDPHHQECNDWTTCAVKWSPHQGIKAPRSGAMGAAHPLSAVTMEFFNNTPKQPRAPPSAPPRLQRSQMPQPFFQQQLLNQFSSFMPKNSVSAMRNIILSNATSTPMESLFPILMAMNKDNGESDESEVATANVREASLSSSFSPQPPAPQQDRAWDYSSCRPLQNPNGVATFCSPHQLHYPYANPMGFLVDEQPCSLLTSSLVANGMDMCAPIMNSNEMDELFAED